MLSSEFTGLFIFEFLKLRFKNYQFIDLCVQKLNFRFKKWSYNSKIEIQFFKLNFKFKN